MIFLQFWPPIIIKFYLQIFTSNNLLNNLPPNLLIIFHFLVTVKHRKLEVRNLDLKMTVKLTMFFLQPTHIQATKHTSLD